MTGLSARIPTRAGGPSLGAASAGVARLRRVWPRVQGRLARAVAGGPEEIDVTGCVVDAAASYRRRTERQRAQAERRFNKEAADILNRAAAQRSAEAKAAYLMKQQHLLDATEDVLRRGTFRGTPLSPSKRAEIESIATDARKAIDKAEGHGNI